MMICLVTSQRENGGTPRRPLKGDIPNRFDTHYVRPVWGWFFFGAPFPRCLHHFPYESLHPSCTALHANYMKSNANQQFLPSESWPTDWCPYYEVSSIYMVDYIMKKILPKKISSVVFLPEISKHRPFHHINFSLSQSILELYFPYLICNPKKFRPLSHWPSFRFFSKNPGKQKHPPSNGNVTERLDPLRKGAEIPIILGVFKVAVLGIAISLLAGKAVLGASALASEPSPR